MANTRYKVKLNSVEKVEQLLQEIYDEANRLSIEVQNEMNKLIGSTNLSTFVMDEKAKYSKAMHDFIGDKNSAIKQKLEVAKFMGELLKHNGDINETLNDAAYQKRTSLDLEGLKKEIYGIDNDGDTEYYDLKGE